MNKYNIFVICIFLFSSINAQNELNLEDVEVLKVFETQLKTTKILDFKQNIPQSKKDNPTFTYQISKLPLVIAYADPVIRPLAVKTPIKSVHYNGFIQLGAGIPKAGLGKAGYNYHYQELYDFNIGLHYLTMDNGSKILNQKFSDFGMLLDGKYHLNDSHTLKASINIEQNNSAFYSTTSLADLSSNADRKMNNIGVHLNYGNDHFDHDKFIFNVGGGIQYLKLRKENLNETSFIITGNSKYRFNNTFSISTDAVIDMNFLNRKTSSEIHAFSIRPALRYVQEIFSISAGLDAIINNQNEKLIFPYLNFKFGLANSNDKKFSLNFIGGIESKHYANSMHHIIDYNPYINVSTFNLNGNFQKKFFLGLESRIYSFLTHFEIGKQFNSNKALYTINDYPNDYQFEVLTDSVATIYARVAVDISFMNYFTTGIQFQFNNYSLEKQSYAWHIPKSHLDVHFGYRSINNKLHFSTRFTLETGAKRKTGDSEYKTLDPLMGLSITSDYSFSKHFGLFINFDNIVNNSAQKWYGYPQMPLNIVGGIKAKF